MPVLRGEDAAAVGLAAARLVAGGLVAFPTETVYGLGARADSDAAVARIFAAKGRPSDHPLIVHVADLASAAAFTPEMPRFARKLVDFFWPGPLTVVVLRNSGLGQAAAGGMATIGLRCPDHPVAQALLQAVAAQGVPGLAAPSANRFGRVSPTAAAHVVAEFGPELMVLDGGACREGIESAIVDCTGERPVLLRPGTLNRHALEHALGQPLRDRDASSPRAPGSLESHYAPLARVELVATSRLDSAVGGAARLLGARCVGVYSRVAPVETAGLLYRAMPDNAALVAHELFCVLRLFDALGAVQIWVEAPPATAEWDGVSDRLRRAATR